MSHLRYIMWVAWSLLMISEAVSQNNQAVFEPLETNLWLGSYNKFRLSDRFFWRAEFHYRRGGTRHIPFAGRMAQIYNRHALNYVHSPRFNASLGFVLRLDFASEPENSNLEYVVPEPRIWHEYMFIMPFERFQLFHRIRVEHRWSRSNALESDWIYRDRWRYKIYANVALNSKKLLPGTLFFNPDVEVILQSGKAVGGSILEDLRIYPSFGYIVTPQVTYTAGMMYTTGQRLNNPLIFRQRWVARLNAYISLDLRKKKDYIPDIRFTD